ncbi:MAG: hypothetical protein JW863_20390 [Chitinispirillaceae bacterium]|nr:hypothetical protein [Chitinispirillaceae bacterium]
MKGHRSISCSLRAFTGFQVFLIAVLPIAVGAVPYQELVPGFKRLKSSVIVRKIDVPTAANLDFAAYDRNPVLHDPPGKKPKKNPSSIAVNGLTFEGALKFPVKNLGATPLSKEEKDRPMAWKPFNKRSWQVVKDDFLQGVVGRINGYKWADPEVYQPYQEVATIYLHEQEHLPEFWVKIEFAPWVSFVRQLEDEDGDGYRELYGKLNIDAMNADSLAKIVAWVKHDYTVTLLDRQQMTDWITDLASYWYPTRNTDILDLGEDGVWPDKRTKRRIVRELDGLAVTSPLAVVEGKPFSPDRPIYNVYIVETPPETPVAREAPPSTPRSEAGIAEAVLSDNFRKNSRVFSSEVARYGSYKKWEEANYPFFDGVRSWLLTFPPEQMGLEGNDGWLFFRKSFDYILSGDIGQQALFRNPLPHITELKNYLNSQGVDLLFVAVPNKEEVYYRYLSDSIPAPNVPILTPYGRKFFADLQQAGVEVIDLLPAYLDAREKDSLSGMFLYQKQDTHWTGRGMEIAADLIAGRIREYSWYKRGMDTVAYTLRDTIVQRSGDLADRLPTDRQAVYKPQSIAVRRVFNPDGTPYRGNHIGGPILLIGDSFTGVFELVDCKSAGIGSHIAARCRLPVDIITSWGGGPMVRQKMLRSRGKYLDRKRVVVYLMVARDLYDYSQGWDPLREGE